MQNESFDSAQAFLQREPFDGPSCLLLDVRMPGLTGLELQAALNERGTSIPIIFLTGHGDTRTGVQAMKDGAVDFLLKPIMGVDTRLPLLHVTFNRQISSGSVLFYGQHFFGSVIKYRHLMCG